MHITGYYWKDREPFIKYINGIYPDRSPLFGKRLNWRIGERRCIGYFDGKKHVPCPTHAISRSSRCKECQLRDWFYNCMKCDGSKCINERRRDDCAKEEYVIYLVTFGPILKVGISQTFRKMTRWMEQGADFAAEVRKVTDGMLARRIESAISRKLKITDRVRGTQKNKVLFYDPNVSLEILQRGIEELNGYHDYEIHDLRSYYHLENVTQQPEEVFVSNGTEIVGKVVAVKGNLMIYEYDGALKMVNLHSLAGRMASEIM